MANGITGFDEQFQNLRGQNGYSVRDMYSSANSHMSETLTSTLRSFKDDLSFNLQTLNLTLNSLNGSMTNLGTKITEFAPNSAGRYIDSGLSRGMFNGAFSREFLGYQSYFKGFPYGMFGGQFIRPPYNVSPHEFYMGADMIRSSLYGGAPVDSFTRMMSSATNNSAYLSPFINSIALGGSTYYQNIDMFRRMSGKFGNQFSIQQAQAAARGLTGLAYNEIFTTSPMDNRLGLSGYQDIAMLGLQGDLFHGSTPQELIKQVNEVSKLVKTFTGILGSKDVKETMEALVRLKQMGIDISRSSGTAFAQSLTANISNAAASGFVNGMTANQMLNAATHMSLGAYGSIGLPATMGMSQAMTNLTYLSEMQKRGNITAAQLAAAGGLESMASRMLTAQAQMMTQSPMGMAYLYAGWQSGTNKFDHMAAIRGAQRYNGLGLVNAGINNIFGNEHPLDALVMAQMNRTNMMTSASEQDPYGVKSNFAQGEMIRIRLNHARKILSTEEGARAAIAKQVMQEYGIDRDSALALVNSHASKTGFNSTYSKRQVAATNAELSRSGFNGTLYNSFAQTFISPIEHGIAYVGSALTDISQGISDTFTLAAGRPFGNQKPIDDRLANIYSNADKINEALRTNKDLGVNGINPNDYKLAGAKESLRKDRLDNSQYAATMVAAKRAYAVNNDWSDNVDRFLNIAYSKFRGDWFIQNSTADLEMARATAANARFHLGTYRSIFKNKSDENTSKVLSTIEKLGGKRITPSGLEDIAAASATDPEEFMFRLFEEAGINPAEFDLSGYTPSAAQATAAKTLIDRVTNDNPLGIAAPDAIRKVFTSRTMMPDLSNRSLTSVSAVRNALENEIKSSNLPTAEKEKLIREVRRNSTILAETYSGNKDYQTLLTAGVQGGYMSQDILQQSDLSNANIYGLDTSMMAKAFRSIDMTDMNTAILNAPKRVRDLVNNGKLLQLIDNGVIRDSDIQKELPNATPEEIASSRKIVSTYNKYQKKLVNTMQKNGLLSPTSSIVGVGNIRYDNESNARIGLFIGESARDSQLSDISKLTSGIGVLVTETELQGSKTLGDAIWNSGFNINDELANQEIKQAKISYDYYQKNKNILAKLDPTERRKKLEADNTLEKLGLTNNQIDTLSSGSGSTLEARFREEMFNKPINANIGMEVTKTQEVTDLKKNIEQSSADAYATRKTAVDATVSMYGGEFVTNVRVVNSTDTRGRLSKEKQKDTEEKNKTLMELVAKRFAVNEQQQREHFWAIG